MKKIDQAREAYRFFGRRTVVALTGRISKRLFVSLIILYICTACRPCGHRASVLYFVLQDLGLADPMYQFSLDAYQKLFVDSILRAKESNAMAASVEEHVLGINSEHTLAVYR